MYVLLNKTQLRIHYKHPSFETLCELALLECPADSYSVLPLETVSKELNKLTTEALNKIYNNLGYNHNINRIELVKRISEFCTHAKRDELDRYQVQFQSRGLQEDNKIGRPFVPGSYLPSKKELLKNLKNISL